MGALEAVVTGRNRSHSRTGPTASTTMAPPVGGRVEAPVSGRLVHAGELVRVFGSRHDGLEDAFGIRSTDYPLSVG